MAISDGGRELRPKGQPEPVRVHDFKIPELGKVAPYGVYDIAASMAGSVSATPQPGGFAVESIRRWWQKLGQALSQGSSPGDHGGLWGSNGPQVRLWKRELQRFANETA